MNRIRYRQFWRDHWFYWGFHDKEHGFIGPLKDRGGYYPESFQSTGFRDQGDRPQEIFADDIILFEGVNCIVRQAKDGTWMLNNDKDETAVILGWAIEHHIEKITVIGNTVENPDLMKEVGK